MEFKCEIIKEDAIPVLSVRTRSSVQDLPQVLGSIYQKIFSYIQELGEYPASAPFVGYFNMDMSDLDIEVGFPITKPLPDKHEIKLSEIPAGEYATTLYTGPYKEIEVAYNALMKWMEDHNYKATGIGYEFYLNDPAITAEDELQTKILFPIEL